MPSEFHTNSKYVFCIGMACKKFFDSPITGHLHFYSLNLAILQGGSHLSTGKVAKGDHVRASCEVAGCGQMEDNRGSSGWGSEGESRAQEARGLPAQLEGTFKPIQPPRLSEKE